MKQDAYVMAPPSFESCWLGFMKALIEAGDKHGNEFNKWPKTETDALFDKFAEAIEVSKKPKSFFECIKTINQELKRSGYDGLDQIGLSPKDFSMLIKECSVGPSTIPDYEETGAFNMLVDEKWIIVLRNKSRVKHE